MQIPATVQKAHKKPGKPNIDGAFTLEQGRKNRGVPSFVIFAYTNPIVMTNHWAVIRVQRHPCQALLLPKRGVRVK